MKQIIDAVDVRLIKSELTADKKLRDTNRGDNEIYILDWRNAPNTLREIGRLRELTFRDSGGGTGLDCDLDRFDLMENPCKQIVIWDPDAEAIIGGYRFILGPDIRLRDDGQPDIAMSHIFHFSQAFIDEYLPHSIELGRSYVTPAYQSSKAGAKAIFALDNLWDGIATIAITHPSIFYMFGKMTMYPDYDRSGRDLILHFLDKHFADREHLIEPLKAIVPETDPRLLDMILDENDFKKDYRNLKDAVKKLGTAIPPLVNSYMNSSPTFRVFGTAVNDEFGDVEETGIIVCYDEMYDDKKSRHVESFIKSKLTEFKARFPKLEEGFERKLGLRWEERKVKLHERLKFKHR